MTQDQINKLMELKKLFEDGIISMDEMEREKAKILGTQKPAEPSTPEEPVVVLVAEPKRKKSLKIPLIIILSLGILALLFLLARRHKDWFLRGQAADGQQTESPAYQNTGGSEFSDLDFEDKFHKMWHIGSVRRYTYDDLKDWSKADLRILRNYYFARNNYKFNSKELNDYFSRYSWFSPLYEADSRWFSQLQTDNVQYIKQLEK